MARQYGSWRLVTGVESPLPIVWTFAFHFHAGWPSSLSPHPGGSVSRVQTRSGQGCAGQSAAGGGGGGG
jgi:hypothetical protein